MKAETTQEFAERLVAEAREVVARQRQFAARLNCEGYTTNEASSLLDNFEIALKNFRRTLTLLQSTQLQ
jgi:hypothetical protein